MEWIEKAEERQIRLLAAEAMPAGAANSKATQLSASKTGVSLLAWMTGRVGRLARARPSRGRGEPPKEGPDCLSRWRARAGSLISERGLLDRRAA
ncbi:MAG TPA: hypothetical protein VEK82_13145 [Stellaceae bacterium]|nr:hypothetical protein [Stellaceae bacterium]